MQGRSSTWRAQPPRPPNGPRCSTRTRWNGRTDGRHDNERRAEDPLSAATGNRPYRLGPAASATLAEIELDPDRLLDPSATRPLLRACVDWSDQRHHLAGRLGVAIAARWFEIGWIERRPEHRAVRVTDTGGAESRRRLGIDIP